MPKTIEDLDPLAAWHWDEEPMAGMVEVDGLINETWGVVVGDEAVAVLQKLNTEIFHPHVHFDIEVVTKRLERLGRVTSRLLPTKAGELWHEDEEGGIWRCFSWVGERTITHLESPVHAESVGFLLGRFHGALLDLNHEFQFERVGIHDTPAHMAGLQQALVSHRSHRLFRQVAPFAERVLDQWSAWGGPTSLPLRVIHGDPKIANIRFVGDDAVALIDLDTLQRGTLDAELGDALRSWCNPATEDDPSPSFDLGLFEAAMRGYVRSMANVPITGAEWRSVVPGVERITLELASRFLRDALEERYFGWDTSFGTAGEHNLARGQAMMRLAESVLGCASEAEGILEDLLHASRSL